MANLNTLRHVERAHCGVGCAISCLDRIKVDLKDATAGRLMDDAAVVAAHRAVVEAIQNLAAAQVKLSYVIQNEVDDMYTAWCGHRFKNGTITTCGCGPAPF